MNEMVKVAMELPRNLHEAIVMVAEKFDKKTANLIAQLLEAELRAMAGNKFQDLITSSPRKS
jgi:hypothetical protein